MGPTKSRGSQPRHWGPHNYCRGYFVLVVCLAVPLASSHSVPATPHILWQHEMSPDIAKCPRMLPPVSPPHTHMHTAPDGFYTHTYKYSFSCSHKNGTLYTTYWTFFHQPQESPYQDYLWCLICTLFLSKPLYAPYLLKQLWLLFQNCNSLIFIEIRFIWEAFALHHS